MAFHSTRWRNSTSHQEEVKNSRSASHQHSANVKNYLGFHSATLCSLNTCPEEEAVSFETTSTSLSPSCMSCIPNRNNSGNSSTCNSNAASTNHLFCDSNSATILWQQNNRRERDKNENNSAIFTRNTTKTSRHNVDAFEPKIFLKAIPHAFSLGVQNGAKQQTSVVNENHTAIETTSSATKFFQQVMTNGISSNFGIDADLDDIDSYMLSVYMNEESSVYTKGTASTASTSSSSLTSSRSRHRGTSQKRRAELKEPAEEQNQKESGFLGSMKQSSSSFFVEGCWSQKHGWYISKKWDASPGGDWDKPNPIFDNDQFMET